MKQIRPFLDNHFLKFGLLSAAAFGIFTAALCLGIDLVFIVICLWLPGTFYGTALYFAFEQSNIDQRRQIPSIVLSSSISYLIVVFMNSRNMAVFIEIRHLISPGIGSLMLLYMISHSYNIKITKRDYFTSFALGILSTFFVWTEKFQSFDPWLMVLGVALWQISNSAHLNFISKRKTYGGSGLPTTSAVAQAGE